MKMSKLLSMLMYPVDAVEYYNKSGTFLYSFPVEEIPENCDDNIIKFNIYQKEDKRFLEVVEK